MNWSNPNAGFFSMPTKDTFFLTLFWGRASLDIVEYKTELNKAIGNYILIKGNFLCSWHYLGTFTLTICSHIFKYTYLLNFHQFPTSLKLLNYIFLSFLPHSRTIGVSRIRDYYFFFVNFLLFCNLWIISKLR